MPSDGPQISRDRKLAKRMSRGNERAIAAFCTEYIPKVYRFARARVPNQHDAEDVVQVVLTNAARRIETYRGEATLLTWLCQICLREIAKQAAVREKHGKVVAFSEDRAAAEVVHGLTAPVVEQPEPQARRAQKIAEVQEVLDQLPDRYAEALELKYVDGLSSKEIAARFGISDEATQSLLARARRSFREHYRGTELNGAAVPGNPDESVRRTS